MAKLSIIILSYNTKEITLSCLQSLYQALRNNKNYQVIVVDNASCDGSKVMLRHFKEQHQDLILLCNQTNLGFTKANNQALKATDADYVLFLNSDVMVKELDFGEILKYLDNHQNIGLLTIKLLLPSGQIDPASHRGFPNLLNSFCYFSKLEKLFADIPPLNRLFGGYHLSYLDLNQIHEIDSPNGAFFLTRKHILDRVGGFDEKFFMYGEDLDLAFRIKQAGFRVIYYPLQQAIHLKYTSGLQQEDESTRKKIKSHFYEAMKIFYKKHYETKYSLICNKLIYFFIDLLYKFS